MSIDFYLALVGAFHHLDARKLEIEIQFSPPNAGRLKKVGPAVGKPASVALRAASSLLAPGKFGLAPGWPRLKFTFAPAPKVAQDPSPASALIQSLASSQPASSPAQPSARSHF